MTKEDIEKIHNFLSRVGSGYVELSHDKIQGEYWYIKKQARELLLELFPREPCDTIEQPLDDNF